MDGPDGSAYPVNINGTTWVEGGGCKAHAC
ncbi:DNA polymerase III subunit gamma/tau, partial [Escherichia coli]|nr:DNA polymerase III subunit gamma/tau [Escherichia coli]